MEQPRWMLAAVEGEYAGKKFVITEKGLTLGREAGNDLVLIDDNVSRRHARIWLYQRRPFLEDFQSRNGTYVNNQKVSRVELQEGDRVALGSHLFKVAAADSDAGIAEAVMPDPERTIVRPHQEANVWATRAISVQPGSLSDLGAALRDNNGPSYRASYDAGAGADNRTGGAIFGGAAADVLVNIGEPPPATRDFHGAVPSAASHEVPSPTQKSTAGVDRDVVRDSPPVYAHSGAQAVVTSSEAVKASRVPTTRWIMLGASGALILGVLAFAARYMQSAARENTGEVAVMPTPVTEIEIAPAINRGASIVCTPATLSAEEQALSQSAREARANEHFDEAERYMGSDKLKEACAEFERALAFNPDCKVCLIRLGKVKAVIQKTLTKYESDALRAFQAMEYDKAMRYWQMVAELESDPASQRRAKDEILKARSQLHKQSYR